MWATVEHAAVGAYFSENELPFALNRRRGRFNICWANPHTPVFLFLFSSGPKPFAYLFPPSVFPPPFLTLPFLFYSEHWLEKASHSRSALHCPTQGHQSHYWVFKVGPIKLLVLSLTLKDVGFTLGWWLRLSSLSLNEPMLAALRDCTALKTFTEYLLWHCQCEHILRIYNWHELNVLVFEIGTTMCALQVYCNCVISDCNVKVIFPEEALFRLSERAHQKFSVCFYL